MAKTPSRLIVPFVAALAIGASAFAEGNEATFTVAPPPVGYPDFNAGDATEQAGGGAVVIKTDYGGLAGWLVGGSALGNFNFAPWTTWRWAPPSPGRLWSATGIASF